MPLRPRNSLVVCPTACYAGRYGLLGALRCLLTSYFTNLVGALMLMGLMVGGGVFIGREAFVIE